MLTRHIHSQCAASLITTDIPRSSTTTTKSTANCHELNLMSSYARISLWTIALVIIVVFSCCRSASCDDDQQQEHFTNEFAVHLKNCPRQGDGNEHAEAVAKRYGFLNHGKIGTLDCHFTFSHQHVNKRSLDYAHDHHKMLAADDDVYWVEQQKVLKRRKRDNSKSKFRYTKPINDPIYADMWYLRKGALGNYDMNVENAWKRGYTGKGVVVTILDDGIQMNHPELVNNYDPQASYDINDNDADPTPQDNGDNKHGTRCAGEVAAEAYNGFCGVGIAFNASIGGVRMLDGVVTDQVEAKAISHNPNHIDIYSASWGPEDDGKTVDGPGKLAKRAFIEGIKKGRRGRGSIYVWASGNGGRRLDNCNCDGYTNSIFTLSISSATQHGGKPWYLEECSSTLSTTYSSGTPGKDDNILTCDQDTSYFKSLSNGEVPQKDSLCTRSHTGTSASAPIAAAIFALALEANPKLTWRDVQHLTILSSRYEPLRHERGWATNGLDRKVSHKFGYGLIDAEAIVKYAEKWTNVPAQRICETPSQNKEKEIPAQTKTQLEATLLTNGCRGSQNEIRYLEHVQTKITLKYQPRGSLRISLISPAGTISNLLYPRPRDTEEVSFNSWPFLSVHFWGEKPTGYWRLIIQNDGHKAAIVPGKLFSWSLIFYGTYEKPISVLYNESSRYFTRSTSPATTKLNECAQLGMLKQYDSEECVKNCSIKQWANTDSGQCLPCNDVCDDCFGPSSDNCLSCAKGYFYEYHCLDRCPDGFYGDDQLKECLPCLRDCLTCSSDRKCLECKNSSKLDQDGNCVALELVPKPNVTCSKNCASCSGTSDCLACETNFFLLNGHCVPDKCLDGFYLDKNEQTSQCYPCHHSCESCDGPSHQSCLTCFKNATLSSKTCRFCLPEHFMNQETMKCEACHASCATCSGPLSNDCLTCRASLFIDNSHCVRCCASQRTNNTFSSSSFTNDMIECCQCLSDDGPCVSIDRPRSIKLSSERIEYGRSTGWIMQMLQSNSFWIVVGLFSICMVVYGWKRLARNGKRSLPTYQKLKSNYSRRPRRNRRQISDLDDIYHDEDEDDNDELTLFEKT